MDTTLWVSEAGGRYFRIPDTVTLLPGGYVILSLFQNRRAEVSEAALGDFEISAASARAHFQAAVGPPVERAAQLLTGGAGPADQPNPQTRRALLGQVLATLLGVAPEQLEAHPTLLSGGAADLLDQIAAAMVNAAASEGPRARARVQLRKLRKQLRAQGLQVDDRLERIAARLPHHQQRLAVLAEQCARLLRDETASVDEQLQELFDTLERDFGGLLENEAERARRDEQRLRAYRQSADDAIARSLRAHGITPTIDQNNDSGEAGSSGSGGR